MLAWKAIKRYYMPLTNCIVIKVVILCDDDDVAWIFSRSHSRSLLRERRWGLKWRQKHRKSSPKTQPLVLWYHILVWDSLCEYKWKLCAKKGEKGRSRGRFVLFRRRKAVAEIKCFSFHLGNDTRVPFLRLLPLTCRWCFHSDDFNMNAEMVVKQFHASGSVHPLPNEQIILYNILIKAVHILNKFGHSSCLCWLCRTENRIMN
jgi:hypothetical protein